MTQTSFQQLALLGRPRSERSQRTLQQLARELAKQGYHLLVEQEAASLAGLSQPGSSLTEIGEQADLAIVVGGDGNMLGAARYLSHYDIGVIGVNRGNLGFLTDLDPAQAGPMLKSVLAGHYTVESKFLLRARVSHQDAEPRVGNAMNEVVLHSDQVAHMIEFEVYVDDSFVFSQRSDGLIIATPTGSTAYALSAGGPILTPGLAAVNLVPMFPHTLSSRPIVVSANSTICIRVAPDNQPLHISCDGHQKLAVAPGDEVFIDRQATELKLIHPTDYDYYHVLRNKLSWGSRLF